MKSYKCSLNIFLTYIIFYLLLFIKKYTPGSIVYFVLLYFEVVNFWSLKKTFISRRHSYTIFRFKREEERKPVLELMKIFLPILQNRCTSLVKDDSPEASVLVAKVFKIFRGLIQVSEFRYWRLYCLTDDLCLIIGSV